MSQDFFTHNTCGSGHKASTNCNSEEEVQATKARIWSPNKLQVCVGNDLEDIVSLANGINKPKKWLDFVFIHCLPGQAHSKYRGAFIVINFGPDLKREKKRTGIAFS